MSERKNNKVGISLLSYSLLYKITTYVIGEISEVSRLVNNRRWIAKNQKKYKRCKTELIYELSQVSKQFRNMFREKEINYNTCINYVLLSRYQKYFIDLSELLLRTGIITDLDKIKTTHTKWTGGDYPGEYTFTLTKIDLDRVFIDLYLCRRYTVKNSTIIWDTTKSQIDEGISLLFYRQCLRYIYASYSKKGKYKWMKHDGGRMYWSNTLTYLQTLTIGEALHFIKDTILPNKKNLYYILNFIARVEA